MATDDVFEEKRCQKFVFEWSSTISKSFMKIGDYACQALFEIFWSLHGIALKLQIRAKILRTGTVLWGKLVRF